MSDHLGSIGLTTNGTRRATDVERSNLVHEGPDTLGALSVDERLEALMETIRTWDWRADRGGAGPPPADETTRAAAVLAATTTTEAREDMEPLAHVASPVQSTADTRSFVLEPMARPVTDPPVPVDPNSDTQTVVLQPTPAPVMDQPDTSDSHSDSHSVVVEPTPAPVTDPPVPVDPNSDTQAVVLQPTPAPVTGPSEPPDPTADTQTVVLDPTLGPVRVDPAVPMGIEDAAADASLSELGPRHRAETWLAPIRLLWSHRWTKVAVLCLAAAVAVILVIWGIRLTHKDPGSGGPTVPPSSTTTTRPATSHIAPTAFVAPLNSAQLAQYEQYAAGLQTANGVAAKGFVGAGSTSTSTQLAPVAAAYRTAVNLYDFQLRFIQWPASMQPAIQVDHAQLEALVSLLTSYPAVSPAGTSAWLAELHNSASTAETADNQIRKDVGLPRSSSFP